MVRSWPGMPRAAQSRSDGQLALRRFAPYISGDGRYLSFTSERPNVAPAISEGRPPGDVYQIDLAAALGE